VSAASTTLEDSLALQFGSSLHISTPPPPAAKKPTNAPQSYKNAKTTRKQTRTQSKTQTLKGLPEHKRTNNSKNQQPTPLTALASLCHTRASLIANKYTLSTNYNIPIEDATTLLKIPLPTPPHNPQSPKRTAILLNYSTINKNKTESEMTHISAIDYFTSEILIDAVLQPIHPIAAWQIGHMEMVPDDFTPAVPTANILRNWPEARTQLWTHMDAATILVGHALLPCLTALRMQHTRIVDTAVLARETLGPRVGWKWSVGVLCHQLLNIRIQDEDGYIVHALAVRKLVERWISNPVEVSLWAQRQQKEWFGRRRYARRSDGGNLPNPEYWIWGVLGSMERNPFSD
jgi:hypothetical protein